MISPCANEPQVAVHGPVLIAGQAPGTLLEPPGASKTLVVALARSPGSGNAPLVLIDHLGADAPFKNAMASPHSLTSRQLQGEQLRA